MKQTRKNDLLRLEHILDAIKEIETILKNISFEDFLENNLMSKAVVFNLLIIGEASKNLSKIFQFEHPDFLYSKIVGMRNRLAHEYYKIDYDIVWQVYKNDLPKLKKDIEPIIKKMENSADY